MPLQMRRIDTCATDARQALQQLRQQLSPEGNLVSERGKALTVEVFGEPLPPSRSVERICQDVRAKGLPAVQRYCRSFDRFELTPANLRVSPAELKAAHARARPGLLETVRQVRQNILAFQLGILHKDAILRYHDGHELRLRYRPLQRIGICVPGGAAAYPSTLLMTVCPAQAAGVKEIAVVAPPTPFGANNMDVLAVCHELGVSEVYRLGGAQAVAALAYGIDGLPAVDMIVGPGNLFVTLAKKYVAGQVGIDGLAGPSEVVILADQRANPTYVAADLIAQAEHSPGASLLITWHEPLATAVMQELEAQLGTLSRGDLAAQSLESFGALIVTRHREEAIELTNEIAPEHLHIQTEEAEAVAELTLQAGAIFLGDMAPVALGDYVAGPSHVLPTGGTARFASGLSANDFLRRTSVLRFDKNSLKNHAAAVQFLADVEGLPGHARSVAVRLEEGK
jgi:histidinol dehydrogenase